MKKSRLKPHFLKDNAGEEWPRHWIFFDSETNIIPLDDRQTQHTFKLGWGCYYRYMPEGRRNIEEWFEVNNPEVFWTWVERHTLPKTKLYLCAHNLTFDTVVMDGIRSLVARGWELKTLITDNALNIWKFRKDTKTIVCIDSLNIFKAALASLGEIVGIPKLNIDFATCSDAELSVYCKNDVRILVEIFRYYRQFLRDHDCGNFAPTLAGQAFNSYRHKHMAHRIFLLLANDVDEFERQAYYGGRVECFRLGPQQTQNYYLLDVNSLYPYVMSNTRLPCQLVDVDWHPTMQKLPDYLSNYFCIADVTISTIVPAFPKRYKDRLVFPIGQFDTVLCSPELDYAIANRHIREVHKVALYKRETLFDSYVSYWYKERLKYKEDGNQILEHFCKLMLNSLYGKFAQRGGEWTEIGKCEPNKIEYIPLFGPNGGSGTIRMFGGVIQEMVKDQLSHNTFSAISAGVTSAARMYLWKLIQVAGQDNVYYCDTDSLIVNQRGRNNLRAYVDKSELGKLKEEKRDYELTLHGAKDYVFAGKTKMKGIRSNAEQLDETTFRQEHWPTLAGLLRSGTISEYYTSKVEKHLRRKYEKGLVRSDGKVVPYYFVDNELMEAK